MNVGLVRLEGEEERRKKRSHGTHTRRRRRRLRRRRRRRRLCGGAASLKRRHALTCCHHFGVEFIPRDWFHIALSELPLERRSCAARVARRVCEWRRFRACSCACERPWQQWTTTRSTRHTHTYTYTHTHTHTHTRARARARVTCTYSILNTFDGTRQGEVRCHADRDGDIDGKLEELQARATRWRHRRSVVARRGRALARVASIRVALALAPRSRHATTRREERENKNTEKKTVRNDCEGGAHPLCTRRRVTRRVRGRHAALAVAVRCGRRRRARGGDVWPSRQGYTHHGGPRDRIVLTRHARRHYRDVVHRRALVADVWRVASTHLRRQRDAADARLYARARPHRYRIR